MKQLSILLGLIPTILINAQTSNLGTANGKPADTFKDNRIENIQEVTIVGKKAVVENKVDKIVYNDVTSQSGAAIDVLRKVPQVTVCENG
ncbi:hypothetical protein J3D55_002157 [Chryseobacterium ginsenosidimutans]|uniref:hypothetical protein n=1 Tax=Chryseobacterium ginsenosidimutans TaxID=687846 RepID=UPI0021680980|nr:hypothetical protein [Chryseobacterium ginsenosidimutans]MCS3869241.1 hypothetical protein [Chryseobacterium ginsenosidimutans]